MIPRRGESHPEGKTCHGSMEAFSSSSTLKAFISLLVEFLLETQIQPGSPSTAVCALFRAKLVTRERVIVLTFVDNPQHITRLSHLYGNPHISVHGVLPLLPAPTLGCTISHNGVNKRFESARFLLLFCPHGITSYSALSNLSSCAPNQVFSKGQVYHKHCFKCNVCHRQLDSRIACDGPDRGIYCNGTYVRL